MNPVEKHRKTPLLIDNLSAFLKRLPSHPKRKEMEEYLARQKAGFKGELSLEYFYRYLPLNEVIFLHNIRILHQNYYFQIDTLILTQKFFLILEIKNLSGQIYFDNLYSQIIRRINDIKESFEDPIYQVERQAHHLSEILMLYKIPFIPIETLVVITNPNTLIESAPSHTDALYKVIKSAGLKKKYVEFKQRYNEDKLTKKELKKIVKLINKLNQPYNPDLCNLFKINKEELIKGVFCPSCEDALLVRRKRSWFCITCKETNHYAHISALKDYARFISTTITNRECMQFLNLPSRSQSYHLLHSLNLPFTGTTKDRTYLLHSLLEE
ncbi:nuclease-related domain-containing protein [Fictibacillus sp. BK138]|uniref:nuclease-related domain-containing protein n=1 Tax=Fictibacillus sp. BK138 TaxID=2512121 RepID=UPI00102A9CCC|nr:nuclease-related domain-containing protein [Fictibacillus sp. BK138]RZT21611.1 nuclease-like protein [Fictibacillus sp. BK138]